MANALHEPTPLFAAVLFARAGAANLRIALVLLGLSAGLTGCGDPSSSGEDDPSSSTDGTPSSTDGTPSTTSVATTTGATTGASGATTKGGGDSTSAGSSGDVTGSSATTAPNSTSTTGSDTATGAGGGGGADGTTTSSETGGGSTTTSGSGVPSVHFVGRIDRSDSAGERFAWSGAGVVAAFEGTEVSVSLDDASENEFTVVLDGEVLPKLAAVAGSQDYLLADSLAAGPHVIELYRRTEASFGVTQFLGLDFGADGLLLEPPALPARLLEFVGDSITCGYGNEGASATCGFSADTENHYLTYAALTARALDAELSTVAWSGKGIIYNYGDDMVDPLPALYDRTLPGDSSSAYEFDRIPDAVVINLGTNDFSTDADPTPELFETEYFGFLQHIRSKYPDAYLLCTVGPLLSGDDLAAARAGISGAVAMLQDEGDDRVVSWELNVANDNPGCDYHPSLETHEAMATAVTNELKAILGW